MTTSPRPMLSANSLCMHDISRPEWDAFYGVSLGTVACIPDAAIGTPSDLARAVGLALLNRDGVGGGGQKLRAYNVLTPADTKTLVATVAMRLPDGVGASSVRLQWRTAAGVPLLADVSSIVALTPSLVVYSLAFDSPTPGTEYQFAVLVNDPLNGILAAKALCGPVRVQALGSSALFSLPFVRLAATDQTMHDAGIAAHGPRSSLVRPGASLRFDVETAQSVDFDRMVIEWVSTIHTLDSARSVLSVYVDDALHATVASTGNAVVIHSTVHLASLPPGEHRISVVAGPQNQDGTGVMMRAAYLPSSSFVAAVVPREHSRRQVAVLCDERALGVGSTAAAARSLAALTARNWPYRITLDGASSRRLFDVANTQALRRATASRLRGYDPTEVWIALDYLDFVTAAWTPAAFGVALGQLVDELLSAGIGRVFVQSALLTANEALNVGGFTIANFRTQEAAVVAARDQRVVLVDGTTILAASDLMSGSNYQPADVGVSKWADALGLAVATSDRP